MRYITDIQDIAEQGFSQPYRCLVDDEEYFVKGLRSTRISQINEWLCGNMAQAVGLPIAPFCLLQVTEEMIELLPTPKRNIGKGAVFASRSQAHCVLLEMAHIEKITFKQQIQLVAFDWFIQNMDRTQGNTNLLFQPHTQKMIVIDHNLAFDNEFQTAQFCQLHIFQAAAQKLANDFVYQQHMEQFLQPAITAYYHAKSQIPPEWHYKNEELDLPTHYPYHKIEQQIYRLQHGTLWSS